MKKKRMSFIMAHADLSELNKMAGEIEGIYKVKATKKPEMGLAMIKVRDGVYRENFYLGEVLITECTVHLDGNLGLGIAAGDSPERAYSMAVVDAAFNASIPEVTELTDSLLVWEKQIEAKRIDDASMVEGSKVKFETMGE